MKRQWVILLLFFCAFVGYGQQIKIHNDIAYINDKAYVKIEKKSNNKFIVYDTKTNDKLLKITRTSSYNQRNKNYDAHIKVYFPLIKKSLIIRDLTIHGAEDIARFLHEEFLFQKQKTNTAKSILQEYKRLSARAKCNKILKNDFTQIYNDYFVSIVKNDTLVLTEVKYLCGYTAFYTKKAMYDRYGKWHKAIYPYEGSHRPNLIWNNIKLFDDIDEKFTVIARGYEGQRAMYASMIVLDENGKDMLAKKAPHRSRLIEFFGYLIKNNSDSRKFYKAYWTTFDPKRWKEMQAYKQRKNTKRSTMPFTQKPVQTRTFERN